MFANEYSIHIWFIKANNYEFDYYESTLDITNNTNDEQPNELRDLKKLQDYNNSSSFRVVRFFCSS